MKLNPKLVKEILELQYPIGKTELFFDNNDHSNYMGFTWRLEAKGKAIVGIDTNDTDFNTIGKTGGSKELQEHDHSLTPGGYSTVMNAAGVNYNVVSGTLSSNVDFFRSGKTGTGNSGNLQPYEVFAIWVRTA